MLADQVGGEVTWNQGMGLWYERPKWRREAAIVAQRSFVICLQGSLSNDLTRFDRLLSSFILPEC